MVAIVGSDDFFRISFVVVIGSATAGSMGEIGAIADALRNDDEEFLLLLKRFLPRKNCVFVTIDCMVAAAGIVVVSIGIVSSNVKCIEFDGVTTNV